MTNSVVGVHEAKTHLSQLGWSGGEEVLIARRGEVVACLVPASPRAVRTLGLDVGRVVVAADFDAEMPDDLFSGTER